MATGERTADDYHKGRLAMRQEGKQLVRISKRIAKRQAIGDDWDGVANDNLEWPLAKALLAEKNSDLLKYAVRYRQIEASATSEAQLGGSTPEPQAMQIDQRTWVDPKTGNMKYKGPRELTSHKFTGREVPANDNRDPMMVKTPAKPTPKPWAGDAKVIAMIDDTKTLARLRVALGPLVEPFESACLYGSTLEKVGREMGVGSTKQASGAARAVMHMALVAIRDTLGELRYEDMAPRVHPEFRFRRYE